MKHGKVWLVGAGPGDPELLTLKAARVLGKADIVIHDDLVHPGTLRYARPGARIVAVGKRGGCRSTRQAFIERLLVAEALAGNMVVRLKGGDPFVFGRGGEEREALRAAGIPVGVVDGITAGIAAPSAIGVPLTHRAACHGAIFVTAHVASNGDDSGPDWAALAAAARSGLTLIIYMGVTMLHGVVEGLVCGGLDPDTPAAIVERATLPGQRAVTTVLERLATERQRHGLTSPSIIVIGKVVGRARLAAQRNEVQLAPAPKRAIIGNSR